MITRETKIDFINKCLRTKSGKKITKTYLRNCSDGYIDGICEKFNESFEKFVNDPPKKLIKFFADVKNIDNKGLTIEGKFVSEEAFRDDLVKEGYKVTKIVPARGKHVCMYCGGIVNGTQKDILCSDCSSTFGHYSYYEL